MKYFLTAFATAVIVFLGATVYYKGLPDFARPRGISVVNTEVAPPIETSTPSPTLTPTVTPRDDSVLVAAIKSALITKYGQNAGDLKVSVSKIEGEYAQGTVSENGGGGGWFAARLNGFWTLVWDGNGQIDCVDISPYPQFPTDMIPECWDASANKLIIR